MTIHTRKFVQAHFAIPLLLSLRSARLNRQNRPSRNRVRARREPTPEPDKEPSRLEQLSRKVEQLKALIERQTRRSLRCSVNYWK